MSSPLLELRYARIRRTELVDPADQRVGQADYDPSILLESGTMILQPGQVYSLEAPNQAGKSTLISALMGVYGGAGRSSNSASLIIEIRMAFEGKDRDAFRSPSEAARAGVAAVFQDDELIGTLTVEEQLLLRHSLKGVPALLVWSSTKIAQRAEDIRDLAIWIREHQNRILPSMPTILSKDEVSSRANELLGRISDISGVDYRSILRRRPIELSGGARAVARLISTLITPDLKLVFLDEAFRGIQSDVWPYLVDALKAIASSRNITVVVVSHNRDEIIRWQPAARFAIEDRVLKQIEPKNHSGLMPALDIGPEFYPVYNTHGMSDEQWKTTISGYCVVIADESLANHRAFREMLNRVELWSDGAYSLIKVAGGEQNKDFGRYAEIVAELCGSLTTPVGTFIVIGGGVALNLGAFVGATIDRGSAALVLVPTTVMAMADVAIGSKTGVNFARPSGSTTHANARKHGIGVYCNPHAVLLDESFLATLSFSEVANGIAECLKHGLCQAADIYERCLDMISHGASGADAFTLARTVMDLKAQILSIDQTEVGIGRILQFGHLHAHALERALSFTIPHGRSVYWGLLVQCILSDTVEISGSRVAERIAGVMRMAGIFNDISMDLSSSAIVDSYTSDSKLFHRLKGGDVYTVLTLPRVGLFENIYEFRSHSSIADFIVSLPRDVIGDAIDKARGLLAI